VKETGNCSHLPEAFPLAKPSGKPEDKEDFMVPSLETNLLGHKEIQKKTKWL
jgi:hypothetical protein